MDDVRAFLARHHIPATPGLKTLFAEREMIVQREPGVVDRIRLKMGFGQGGRAAPARSGGLLQRCTRLAKQVLGYAQEEARNLDHPYVGTEHLLLGMLGLQDSAGYAVLEHLAVDAASLREALAAPPDNQPPTKAGDNA